MVYKAIVADIGGTIVPVNANILPTPTVKKAIGRAAKKGVNFSLATGRPFELAEHFIESLRLKSPLIVDNGAAIISADTRRPLYDAIIDIKEVRVVVKIITRYNKSYHVSCVNRNLPTVRFISSSLEVRKIIVRDLRPSEAEDLISLIASSVNNLYVSKTSANNGRKFLDVCISHASATKQNAIKKLAEILGIDTKEIIAIGDHYNDLPLFMACGLKVAMGNAVDDLKAIADYVAPSLDNDGVADVIEKFIL
jgi:HAD superfamily hydrolase (TIGR01484 family)